MNLTTHELRCSEFVPKYVIQISEVVLRKSGGQNVARLTYVNDPVSTWVQAVGAKLDVACVSGTMQSASWTEFRIAVKTVGDHERISDTEAKGHLAFDT
jgi:hypothetical protein